MSTSHALHNGLSGFVSLIQLVLLSKRVLLIMCVSFVEAKTKLRIPVPEMRISDNEVWIPASETWAPAPRVRVPVTRRHEVLFSSVPSKTTCPSSQNTNPRLSSLNPRTGNVNPSAQSSNSSGFVEASGPPQTLSGAPDRKMTQMNVFWTVFLIEKDGRPKMNSDVIWQAVWPKTRVSGTEMWKPAPETRAPVSKVRVSGFKVRAQVARARHVLEGCRKSTNS